MEGRPTYGLKDSTLILHAPEPWRSCWHHECQGSLSALADTALISTSIWSLHLIPSRSPRLMCMQDQCTILECVYRTAFHPRLVSYRQPPEPRQRSERKGSVSPTADTALVRTSLSPLDHVCERPCLLKPVIPSVSKHIERSSIHSVHHMDGALRCDDGPGARLMAWRSDSDRQ